MFVARKNEKLHQEYSLGGEKSTNVSKDKLDDRRKYRSLTTKEHAVLVASNQRANTKDMPKDLIYNGANPLPPVPLGASDE